MSKKITLSPEFPRKISTMERVYNAIKEGAKNQKDIKKATGLLSGGNISSNLQALIDRGLVKKRACECELHYVYEVA